MGIRDVSEIEVLLQAVGPLVILLAVPVLAANPMGRCKAVKLKAAGIVGARMLQCHEKAARKGVVADPGCLEHARLRLALGFGKSEKRAKGRCEIEEDASDSATIVDVLVATSASALLPTSTISRCGAAKLKAVRKKVLSNTRAQAGNAMKPDAAALAAELQRATAAFTAAVAKAEAKGGCQTTGDGAQVALIADAFVDALLDPYLHTLKEEAAPDRVVGAAVRSYQLFNEPPYATTLLREFSQLTPEFEMIWLFVQPAPGVWNFAATDALVDFAELHGLQVQGGPLVWHHFTAAFAENLDAAALGAALEAHVRAVVARYRGRIASYVVVNEAVAGSELQRTLFLERLGSGYIADAFRWAHEEDPDALLFLNDFGIEGIGGTADFVYTLVQGLLQQGVPIHGIGLQCHFTIYPPPSAESIRQNIQRFAALGLQVQLTELDVGPDDDSIAQRRIYHDVAAACSAEPACTGVTTWGLTDKYHWLGREALAFDAAYAPKPNYFGLRDGLAGR